MLQGHIHMLLRHHRLIIKSVLLLSRFRLLLAFTKYTNISKRIAVSALEPGLPLPIGLYVWSTELASRIVPNATCLAQALTLQKLLANQGDVAVIRVGVQDDVGGSVKAHAWVIHDGTVLLGGRNHNLDLYTKIVDLEPSRT